MLREETEDKGNFADDALLIPEGTVEGSGTEEGWEKRTK